MNNTQDASHSPARFARRLRVVTEPKHSNKMHRTRTLSELIMLSPRNSLRSDKKRLDMDIEVSMRFAEQGEALVDLFGIRTQNQTASRPHRAERFSFFSTDSFDSRQSTARFSDAISEEEEDSDNQQEDESSSSSSSTNQSTHDHDTHMEEDATATTTTTTTIATEPEAEPVSLPARSVSEVIDCLFEIHTALKTKHLGQRTAASALAASNLVSTLSYPALAPIPRDEQLEALENTRKMLECAICQEVFTQATEATCCGQIFCKECIERWVSERGSCPMCREHIGFSLLVSSRHAQRMANEMKVPCLFCAASMKKAMLADHVTVCDMAPVEPPPPGDVALRTLLVATARLNVSFLRRFVLAPSPREALMTQCYIRTRGGGNYELYTQDTDTLLLTAVRRRQYDMSISFQILVATSTEPTTHQVPPLQVARLDKNYMGSQYTMYDTTGEQPVELGAVQYAATFGKSPRQMRVALPLVRELPAIDASASGQPNWEIQPWSPQSKEDTILAQVEAPEATRALHLINKPPVWIESLEAYCLDFGGRVAAASVKNFLLAHPDDMDKTLMLFGRTQDRQVYAMDYAHPVSPAQAFAIALSSMDSHLVTFD